MVVAAHPDDELLGLGATMHRLIREQEVTTHVVILGEGLTSRADRRDTEEWEKELAEHRKNMHKAQEKIGYHSLNAHDFPDNRFDTVALLDLIKVVEQEKKEFRPEVIFAHHGGDLNIDHRRTFEAVMTASRPVKGEETKTILTFETPSSTEWAASSGSQAFHPNVYIEVSEKDLQAKIEGMECYRYEKRDWPHPRSPEALRVRARHMGAINGCDYAEAFNLVRSIL